MLDRLPSPVVEASEQVVEKTKNSFSALGSIVLAATLRVAGMTIGTAGRLINLHPRPLELPPDYYKDLNFRTGGGATLEPQIKPDSLEKDAQAGLDDARD